MRKRKLGPLSIRRRTKYGLANTSLERILGFDLEATDAYLQWPLHWPGLYPNGERRIMADAVDRNVDRVAALLKS